MRKQLVSFLVLCSAIVTGCHKTPPPRPVPIGPLPPGSFARKWVSSLDLRGDQISHLHLRDQSLFVYTGNHTVYSLARDSGVLTAASAVTSPATRLGPPVVLGDKVVYPTNTTLEIFDLTGHRVRSVALNFAMRSPAIGLGNFIYVGADFPGGGRFVALDLSKSYFTTPHWAFVTRGGVSAAPAIVDNQIFVGSEDNSVYAVTTERNPIWPLSGFAFETAGRVLADIKADAFGVYFASTDTKLYCIDRTSGKIKWQFYAQHPLEDAPIVTATTVYQAVPKVGLAAIDKINGKYNRDPKWISDAVIQVLSEDEIHVYGRLRDNSIVAIDKQTGEQKFKSRRHDFHTFATNTKDATIFAATASGKVYAIMPVLRAGIMGELVLIDNSTGLALGG